MNDEEHENPFYRGMRRELYSSWEFEDFQRKVESHIEAVATDNPRLQQMKRAVGFYIDAGHGDRVQVWFGVHRRRKLDKELLSENGACLVYSRPFVGGGVVTTLFPAKSDDARVNEDRIYIRIGDYSGAQLMGWVKKDLANLVAYAHVTSIDGTPTIAERFRVGWLRRFHPMSVEDKHTPASGIIQAKALADFTGRTLLLAVLKPVGILAVIVILLAMGLPQLAALLPR